MAACVGANHPNASIIRIMATKNCPHLGRRDDPSTLFNYPSVGNYCHHVRPLAPPHEEHQAQYCLSGNFQQCPIYQTPVGKHIPPSIQMQTPEWDETAASQFLQRFSIRQLGILLALGVLILLSTIIYVFATNWNTLMVPASPAATSTLIPTHPLPTLTPFPLGGTEDATLLDSGILEIVTSTNQPPTHTSTPSQATNPTLSPSPTNCVHPLNWVWYTVQAGDTLSSLSRTTGVTVAQLQQANCLGTSTQIVTGQNLSVPKLQVLLTATPTLLSSPEPFSTKNPLPLTEKPVSSPTPASASTEALNPTLPPTDTISPGI